MKDWDLAGEKPSFIVVLSKFPHQNGIHWRWPSFPVGFVFLLLRPCNLTKPESHQRSHCRLKAFVWKWFKIFSTACRLGFIKRFEVLWHGSLESVSADPPLCLWQMMVAPFHKKLANLLNRVLLLLLQWPQTRVTSEKSLPFQSLCKVFLQQLNLRVHLPRRSPPPQIWNNF